MLKHQVMAVNHMLGVSAFAICDGPSLVQGECESFDDA